jgi:hypothetical protein
MQQHLATACALVGAALAGGPAAADEAWTHTLYVYGMGAAIDGKTELGPLEVDVDLSASDVLDALEMGVMAAYRADNGTWSYMLDATFMGLGGSSSTDGGNVRGTVDIDQLTLMATVGRRLTPSLEVLASLAYFDLSTKLQVKTTNPLTGETTIRNARKDSSWVDPMVGLQFNVPVGERWRLGLRGDVGGFGIGSDLALHALASLLWAASDKVGVYFGYRVIDFDYEDGQYLQYERYDLTEQGPLIGFSVAF